MMKKLLFGLAVLVGSFLAMGNLAHAQMIPPSSVRYIKVQVTNSKAWVIFNEAQVYDANGNKITISPANVAVSGSCANTGGYQCDSSIGGLVDGNTTTGWNAGDTAPGCNWSTSASVDCAGNGIVMGASFTLDLGSVQNISRISLLPQNTPDPANATYVISGSVDGNTYTTLGTMDFTGVMTSGQWVDMNPANGAFTVTNSPTAPISSSSNVTLGPPTASLTVNGSNNLTITNGTPIVLSWNSTNADGATFTASIPASCSGSYLLPPAFGTGQIVGGPTPPLEGSKFNGQYAFALTCQDVNGSNFSANAIPITITYTATQQSTGLKAVSTANITIPQEFPTIVQANDGLNPILIGPSTNYQGTATLPLYNNPTVPPTLSATNVPTGMTVSFSPWVLPTANAGGYDTLTVTASQSVEPGIYTMQIDSSGLPSSQLGYGLIVGVTTSTNPTCVFNDTCNNTAGSASTYVSAPPSNTSGNTPPASGANVITNVLSYNFQTNTWGTSAAPVGNVLVLYSASTNSFSSSNNTIAIDGTTVPSAATYQSTSQLNVPLTGIAVGTHTVTVTTASGATGSASFSVVSPTTTNGLVPPPLVVVGNPAATTDTGSTPDNGVDTSNAASAAALAGILASPPAVGPESPIVTTPITTPASCPGAQSVAGFPITVTVTASALNVRSGPHTSASLAGSQTVSAGDTFVAINEVQGDNVEGSNLWWESCAGNYVWAGGTTSGAVSSTGTASGSNDAAIQAEIANLTAEVSALETKLCGLEPGSSACSGSTTSVSTTGASTCPSNADCAPSSGLTLTGSVPLQVACWSDNLGMGIIGGGPTGTPCSASGGCVATQISWGAAAIGGIPFTNQYVNLNASGAPAVSGGTPYYDGGYDWKWSGDAGVSGVALPDIGTQYSSQGVFRLYPAPGALNSWVTSETAPPSKIPATITVFDAAGNSATASCSAQYPGSLLDGIPTLPAMSSASMSYSPLPTIAATDVHGGGFTNIEAPCQKFVTGNPIVDQDLYNQVQIVQQSIMALQSSYPSGYFNAELGFIQACKNNAITDLDNTQAAIKANQSLSPSTTW